jgi:hypothetical protein
MTATSGPWPQQKRLAELTSLLFLVDPVPDLPSKNPLPSDSDADRGYSLPLKDEAELAEILAFLSSTKDDPSRIPAVGIEESTARDCLRVLLAVNKASHNDGDAILEAIKAGFEEVFTILNEYQVDDREGRMDLLLTAIVTMCYKRILCRLRLISNSRSKPKKPFKEVLQNAVNAINQMEFRSPGDMTAAAKDLLENAKTVARAIDLWTKHQTVIRLISIVKAVKILSETPGLQEMLDLVPNTLIEKPIRDGLLNIIRKISRYEEIVKALLRMTRRYPIVRNMKVVLAKLPESAFARVSIANYTPNIASTIPPNFASRRQHILEAMQRLLLGGDNIANDMFKKQVYTTLKEAKIHAEIQVYFYAKLYTSGLPPRVISSSKDACYLCNAFIALDTDIHTTRCHGRLYTGWFLPTIPGYRGVHKAFNKALEQRMQTSLTALLTKKKRYDKLYPNESTLGSLIVSSSTIAASLDSERERNHQERTSQPPIGQVVEDAVPDSEAIQPLRESLESLPRLSTSASAEKMATTPGPVDVVPEILITAPTMSMAGAEPITLSQGQRLEYHTRAYTGLPAFKVGKLKIHVEDATVANRLQQDPARAPLSVEWLTPEQVHKLAEDEKNEIVDAETLSTVTELVVKDPTRIYIAGKGAVVRISLPSSHGVRQ